MSAPFENFTFRDRYDVEAENDSDASYDTDEERKKFQYELLKEEFSECFIPVPRGIQQSCYICKASVVVRTEKVKSDVERKFLVCEKAESDYGGLHYRRLWDEAITEELEDRKEEILKLKEKVIELEELIAKLTT